MGVMQMAMQAINAINRKIKDTEKEIANLQESKDETSAITQFMLSELRRKLKDLSEQRKHILAAQEKETISLRMYGETIEYGKISNRILVSVLGGFQALLDSIATVSDGSRGMRGKFKTNAQRATDFKIVSMYPGSFGVVLEKECQQMELTSNSNQTENIICDLFDILENSTDAEKLVRYISPFGKRTINHYREWLKNIGIDGINLEMNWTDNSAGIRKINIVHDRVEDVICTLDSIEDIVNEEVEENGILTGINIRQNTFEMKCDEGIIKGTSKMETLIQISSDIGKEIRACLVKSTLQSQNFVSNTTWYLKGIK